MKYIKYTLFVIITTLLLAEIILRIKGTMNVYSETMGNGYISPYSGVRDTWYHTWTPDYTFTPNDADYHYPFKINRYGFRDKDYDLHKPDSVMRILITGDSFTEGMGAPYDSTWPRLLEKYLHDKNINTQVIDAGESGSDIIYDYVFYRDILNKFHPDLVIASMNTSDYIDCYYRGGMERFHPDGTTHYNRPPVIEYFYHYSHLFRAFYERHEHPLKGVYLDNEQFSHFISQMNPFFTKAVQGYCNEARKNDSQFVFVYHVSPVEINANDFTSKTSIDNFALLGKMVKGQGVPCIDLITGLNEALGDKPWQYFTYEHDKHYTPAGYAAFAKAAGDSLISDGFVK